MYNYIISIDFGYKHIGLAITQNLTYVIKPLKYIKIENKIDWNKIIQELKKWNPIYIIIGLNKNNKNFFKKTKQFIIYIKKYITSKIFLQDETYTTILFKKNKLINIHIQSAQEILKNWILRNKIYNYII